MALRQAVRLARDLGRPVTVVHAVGLLEEGGYRSAPSVDEVLATLGGGRRGGRPGAGASRLGIYAFGASAHLAVQVALAEGATV